MIIKTLTKLGKRMDEHCKKFNRVRKYDEEPSRGKNIVTEIKNALAGSNIDQIIQKNKSVNLTKQWKSRN